MTDRPDLVRHSRRFVVPQPDGDIHGIQLPSGLVIYDRPGIGLEAATGIEHIPTATPDATVHWADEEQQ